MTHDELRERLLARLFRACQERRLFFDDSALSEIDEILSMMAKEVEAVIDNSNSYNFLSADGINLLDKNVLILAIRQRLMGDE